MPTIRTGVPHFPESGFGLALRSFGPAGFKIDHPRRPFPLLDLPPLRLFQHFQPGLPPLTHLDPFLSFGTLHWLPSD